MRFTFLAVQVLAAVMVLRTTLALPVRGDAVLDTNGHGSYDRASHSPRFTRRGLFGSKKDEYYVRKNSRGQKSTVRRKSRTQGDGSKEDHRTKTSDSYDPPPHRYDREPEPEFGGYYAEPESYLRDPEDSFKQPSYGKDAHRKQSMPHSPQAHWSGAIIEDITPSSSSSQPSYAKNPPPKHHMPSSSQAHWSGAIIEDITPSSSSSQPPYAKNPPPKHHMPSSSQPHRSGGRTEERLPSGSSRRPSYAEGSYYKQDIPSSSQPYWSGVRTEERRPSDSDDRQSFTKATRYEQESRKYTSSGKQRSGDYEEARYPPGRSGRTSFAKDPVHEQDADYEHATRPRKQGSSRKHRSSRKHSSGDNAEEEDNRPSSYNRPAYSEDRHYKQNISSSSQPHWSGVRIEEVRPTSSYDQSSHTKNPPRKQDMPSSSKPHWSGTKTEGRRPPASGGRPTYPEDAYHHQGSRQSFSHDHEQAHAKSNYNTPPKAFPYEQKHSIPIREGRPPAISLHEDEDPNKETNPRWKALKIKKAEYRKRHGDQQLTADAQEAFENTLHAFSQWDKTRASLLTWEQTPWPVLAPPNTIVPTDVTHGNVVDFFKRLRDKKGYAAYKTSHRMMSLLFAADKWPVRRSKLRPDDADLIVETMQTVYVGLLEVGHETKDQEEERKATEKGREKMDRWARDARKRAAEKSPH